MPFRERTSPVLLDRSYVLRLRDGRLDLSHNRRGWFAWLMIETGQTLHGRNPPYREALQMAEVTLREALAEVRAEQQRQQEEEER